MKKNLLWFFGLAIVASFAFSSCDGDACEKIDCVNGDCFEGTCNCTPGYEYDADGKCTVESRAKLAGKYSTTEKCSTDPVGVYYEITVNSTVGADVTKIDVLNFYNSFASTAISATVETGNKITIPTQVLGAAGTTLGIEFAGSGTYEVNAAGKTVITLTYTAKDLDATPVATATCSSTVYTHL
jgi:hypothetical protein